MGETSGLVEEVKPASGSACQVVCALVVINPRKETHGALHGIGMHSGDFSFGLPHIGMKVEDRP